MAFNLWYTPNTISLLPPTFYKSSKVSNTVFRRYLKGFNTPTKLSSLLNYFQYLDERWERAFWSHQYYFLSYLNCAWTKTMSTLEIRWLDENDGCAAPRLVCVLRIVCPTSTVRLRRSRDNSTVVRGSLAMLRRNYWLLLQERSGC